MSPTAARKAAPAACCDAMAEIIRRHPDRDEGLEQDPGGGWNLNGCCGGGCYVLINLRFCPFCGRPLVAGKEGD